ncbi:transposase domain-containing protein [Desulfocucumis palustris]|uniref:transposase domain-containing protein n=1 Tax=Desulfocucumis palustris TaxID=1898651 RepID=UPI004039DBD4
MQRENAFLVFSIIETATANDLDPYEYLVYIFKSLPNLDFQNNPEILDDCIRSDCDYTRGIGCPESFLY